MSRNSLIFWRRGSESNRRTRLCRPLHDHSATPPPEVARLLFASTRLAHAQKRMDPRRAALAAHRLEAGIWSCIEAERERRSYRFDLPGILERETRLELATPTLARLCSTTELFPREKANKGL